ncbi:MAG: antitoxin [Crocosphaera sp.]
MTKLNQEEQEFLDSYNNDEWYSVGTAERLTDLQSFAEATLTKEETITVQLSYLDLEAIQAKAKEEGISERRLISSLLHKYVTGKLVEISP